MWDFRAASAKGNPNAFVLAAKVGDIPAPTGKQDIDWLQLNNVSGSLATTVYRTDTRGGQPPASVGLNFYVGVCMTMTASMYSAQLGQRLFQ